MRQRLEVGPELGAYLDKYEHLAAGSLAASSADRDAAADPTAFTAKLKVFRWSMNQLRGMDTDQLKVQMAEDLQARAALDAPTSGLTQDQLANRRSVASRKIWHTQAALLLRGETSGVQPPPQQWVLAIGLHEAVHWRGEVTQVAQTAGWHEAQFSVKGEDAAQWADPAVAGETRKKQRARLKVGATRQQRAKAEYAGSRDALAAAQMMLAAAMAAVSGVTANMGLDVEAEIRQALTDAAVTACFEASDSGVVRQVLEAVLEAHGFPTAAADDTSAGGSLSDPLAAAAALPGATGAVAQPAKQVLLSSCT